MKILITCLISMCFLINTDARVIHSVYFQPTDIPAPTDKQLSSIKESLKKTQMFFASEMHRHKFDKSFAFETDKNHDILIHIVKGKHQLNQYTDLNKIHAEMPPELQKVFWLKRKIRVVYLGGAHQVGRGGFTQTVCQNKLCGHTSFIPANNFDAMLMLTAHEIGHTFNLRHNSDDPPIDKNYIMKAKLVVTREATKSLKSFIISKKEAETLNADPHFKSEQKKTPDPHKPGLGGDTENLWSSLKLIK